MAFTPVVVAKDGRDNRVARTAVELVQYEYDGWSAVAQVPADGSAPEKRYPQDYTVDEVNAYLETVEGDEVVRVFEEEAAGEARKGILEGPQAVRHIQ